MRLLFQRAFCQVRQCQTIHSPADRHKLQRVPRLFGDEGLKLKNPTLVTKFVQWVTGGYVSFKKERRRFPISGPSIRQGTLIFGLFPVDSAKKKQMFLLFELVSFCSIFYLTSVSLDFHLCQIGFSSHSLASLSLSLSYLPTLRASFPRLLSFPLPSSPPRPVSHLFPHH